MDHQKIYNSIIKKARSENRIRLKRNQKFYVYYENHHILPKCLGGTNIEENLVLLTAKEHFICHKLLTYIYSNNRKIALAFHRMTYNKNGNYNKSLKDYKYARELISLIPISKEQKQKISISNKKPKSKEHIEKFKGNKNGLGYKHTKEAKKKISNALSKRKGEKNPNYGKPAWNKGISPSNKSIEKNRKSHLGKIPWNKGLSKDTDERVKQYGLTRSKSSIKY